jgi:hypothetical protein
VPLRWRAARARFVQPFAISSPQVLWLSLVIEIFFAALNRGTVVALVGSSDTRRRRTETTMNSAHKWIIVLVASDDPAIETRVIKERLAIEDDEQLAALLRGGELVAVSALDNEAAAEAQRIEVERACLR